MLDEVVCSTDVSQAGKTNLRNDRPKLTASRRDTVCCGTVTGGEGLSRNNECGNIRPEVLEEVGQAVEDHKPMGMVVMCQGIIAET